jgi:hypothetical protein
MAIVGYQGNKIMQGFRDGLFDTIIFRNNKLRIFPLM